MSTPLPRLITRFWALVEQDFKKAVRVCPGFGMEVRGGFSCVFGVCLIFGVLGSSYFATLADGWKFVDVCKAYLKSIRFFSCKE